jgi:hypothetical protein
MADRLVERAGGKHFKVPVGVLPHAHSGIDQSGIERPAAKAAPIAPRHRRDISLPDVPQRIIDAARKHLQPFIRLCRYAPATPTKCY